MSAYGNDLNAIIDDLENQIAELQAGMDQAEGRVAELEHELMVVLPMAKGYAAAHDVGNNRRMVNGAEQALSSDGSRIMDVVKAALAFRESCANNSHDMGLKLDALCEAIDNLDRSEGG